MFLETLLSIGCIFGNEKSCQTGASTYYSYSGLESKVNKLTEKHIYLSYVSGVAGLIRDKKVLLPIYRGSGNAIDIEVREYYHMMLYKRGW